MPPHQLRTDPEAQQRIRQDFQHLLEHGYTVTNFTRGETEEFYTLEQV